MAIELNISKTLMGTMASVFFAALTIAPLLMGVVADKKGKKPVILLALALIILGAAVCMISRSAQMVFIGVAVVGLGTGTLESTYTAALFDYDPKRAGKNVNLNQAVLSLACCAMPLVNKAGITKKTLKKLKVGATYYVQVRSFKKIENQTDGKTAITYGKWSNKKKFVAMQKVNLTSARPQKGMKAIVKWKKCKAVTGYQIRYSTNKKFKKAKKVKVKKARTTKKTIKKLKAGKTYYVQVRTFKKIKKKTVYGKWSKTRKFKANK